MPWWQIALVFAGIPSGVGMLVGVIVWCMTAPPARPRAGEIRQRDTSRDWPDEESALGPSGHN